MPSRPLLLPQLHSFPTRRSSDLVAARDVQRRSQAVEQHPDVPLWVTDADCDELRDIFTAQQRSEEHTSELQSRLQLVCRLLLEKKKLARDSMKVSYSLTRLRRAE